MISGGHHSTEFTKSLADVLRTEFRLGDRVELITPVSADQEKKLGISRGGSNPFVVDHFNNTEMRADAGKAQLYDLRDNYLAVVTHLYDRPLSGLSVNDNLMQVRYIFDMLNQGEVNALRKVLVVPYLPFVGAHSIEKYKKIGFIEADRLDIFVQDLSSVGIQDLFSIHPHSMDIMDHCEKWGVTGHMKESFTGPKDTDYCKLGFTSREEAKAILKDIHPYTAYLENKKRELGPGERIVLVVSDDGAERITRMIVTGIEAIDYCDLLYFNKKREGEGQSKIIGVKRFSGVRLNQIENATCIICDDVIRSGGTLNDAAGFLKKYRAKSVEGWVTHAECPGQNRIELPNIDRIVALDTLPHRIEGVTYISGAAHILAASIYRNFCNELEKKGEPLTFMGENHADYF